MYVLQQLIEVEQTGGRYHGVLTDGRRAEIFLVQANLAQSYLDAIHRRMRFVDLLKATNVRQLYLVDLDHQPPVVALEEEGEPLSELVSHRAIEPSSAEKLVNELVATLEQCHRFGFAIGKLSYKIISRTIDKQWKFDLTGLRSQPVEGEAFSDSGTGMCH